MKILLAILRLQFEGRRWIATFGIDVDAKKLLAGIRESPGRHLTRNALLHGDDDVDEHRPGMIEVILRGPRRVIGMRMVEAKKLHASPRCLPLGAQIVAGSDEKTPA